MSYIAIALILFLSFPGVVHEASRIMPEPIVDETGAVLSSDTLASSGSAQLPDILVKIAECESSSRHYDSAGNVISGAVNKYDKGKYQINVLYWQGEADKLGYDLLTEEGNEAMALYLFRKYGTSPWRSSKKCWASEA